MSSILTIPTILSGCSLVAQALALGARSREFKSLHPDQVWARSSTDRVLRYERNDGGSIPSAPTIFANFKKVMYSGIHADRNQTRNNQDDQAGHLGDRVLRV